MPPVSAPPELAQPFLQIIPVFIEDFRSFQRHSSEPTYPCFESNSTISPEKSKQLILFIT
jgi:hypothetical protein